MTLSCRTTIISLNDSGTVLSEASHGFLRTFQGLEIAYCVCGVAQIPAHRVHVSLSHRTFKASRAIPPLALLVLLYNIFRVCGTIVVDSKGLSRKKHECAAMYKCIISILLICIYHSGQQAYILDPPSSRALCSISPCPTLRHVVC
ncbi:hypothetical protein DAEQUDRAFT_242942 [Daedalea quercina L-15889]|uniref:Uncharacterized protein n=1 Tax=Daedalea quercina L-15889 TaxID=1314783 RepID=A0A165QS51_9APHY|nr:hypothetical protein DAEQUDRAFT_242942 [Daedalea quercina L-15889]